MTIKQIKQRIKELEPLANSFLAVSEGDEFPAHLKNAFDEHYILNRKLFTETIRQTWLKNLIPDDKLICIRNHKREDYSNSIDRRLNKGEILNYESLGHDYFVLHLRKGNITSPFLVKAQDVFKYFKPCP